VGEREGDGLYTPLGGGAQINGSLAAAALHVPLMRGAPKMEKAPEP